MSIERELVDTMLVLSSAQSTRISLESIRCGKGGLDAHRGSMLARVPQTGDWERFEYGHLEMNDLAYLTAKTGHEFAILRGKNEDVLFHGETGQCRFDSGLVDMLRSGKLIIYGHSHPGEEIPVPSPQDRAVLREIGQSESRLISGLTGRETIFTADPFEII